MTDKHSIQELYEWQALPLNVKILMTKRRIRDWVNYYGEEGVYVSFSGGKDSTVLLDMAREMYPNIKAMFVDTGLEYIEIREHIKTFDNVDWIRPRMGFKKVCNEYGFPLISKQVSGTIQGARKYIQSLTKEQEFQNILINEGLANGKTTEWLMNETVRKYIARQEKRGREGSLIRLASVCGMFTSEKTVKANPQKEELSKFTALRYYFLMDAGFEISNKCCDIMKKEPAHQYSKETGRMGITAQMAEESRLRLNNWLIHGCNAFESRNPISNPMSFWTEQDVLLYIKNHNLPIASVYGDVIVDCEGTEQLEGQMSIADYMTAAEKEEFELDRPLLKTTGCKRTGCILCGFGCHLEKGESRFERLKKTHPSAYKALDVVQNNGVTYRQAIDWINEHNGKGKIIRY